MAQRITRKSIKHDEFVEAAVDAGEWIERHWRPVAAGVAAALVLLFLVLVWNWWSGKRAGESASLLSEGIALYEGGTGSAGSTTPATAPRYDEALAKFEEAARKGHGTSRGRAAEYYRGATLLRMGRAREAVPVLESVVGEASERVLADGARVLLAQAYAQAGDLDKATAAYRALAGQTNSSFPPDMAMLQLSRLLEEHGKTAEARQVLQDIVAKFPQGPAASEARTRLQGAARPAGGSQ